MKLEYLPSAAAALIVRKSIESRCVRGVAGGGTSQYFVTRLQSCGRGAEAANYTKCPIISIITLLTNTQIYTHMGSEMLWPRVPGVLVLVLRFMVSINKAEAAVAATPCPNLQIFCIF